MSALWSSVTWLFGRASSEEDSDAWDTDSDDTDTATTDSENEEGRPKDRDTARGGNDDVDPETGECKTQLKRGSFFADITAEDGCSEDPDGAFRSSDYQETLFKKLEQLQYDVADHMRMELMRDVQDVVDDSVAYNLEVIFSQIPSLNQGGSYLQLVDKLQEFINMVNERQPFAWQRRTQLRSDLRALQENITTIEAMIKMMVDALHLDDTMSSRVSDVMKLFRTLRGEISTALGEDGDEEVREQLWILLTGAQTRVGQILRAPSRALVDLKRELKAAAASKRAEEELLPSTIYEPKFGAVVRGKEPPPTKGWGVRTRLSKEPEHEASVHLADSTSAHAAEEQLLREASARKTSSVATRSLVSEVISKPWDRAEDEQAPASVLAPESRPDPRTTGKTIRRPVGPDLAYVPTLSPSSPHPTNLRLKLKSHPAAAHDRKRKMPGEDRELHVAPHPDAITSAPVTKPQKKARFDPSVLSPVVSKIREPPTPGLAKSHRTSKNV